MAKIENQQEAAVAEAVSKTEQFFQKNGKSVVIALVVVVLLVVCGYLYKSLVIDSNEQKASEMIVEAQDRFAGENPDFALALNGDENGAGFLDVAEQYGSTAAGNIANHYAGICYLRLGDLENAEKYLAQYDAVDELAGEVVNAQNLGLRGDIAVEKGEYEAAVALYKKAVAASKNIYTAPLYLYKQVLAYAALGNKAEAQKCFETLQANYPMAVEVRDAEKVLGSF
ncbi:MAG: tetratricopeptide repeat protein [Alistipes sp.]|nr:tetratricopeptide repeat protein [Alistipes sp.]